MVQRVYIGFNTSAPPPPGPGKHSLKRDVDISYNIIICSFFRIKAGGNPTESALIAQLEQGLALEFERSDAARKLRLLLSELLFVTSQVGLPYNVHFLQSLNKYNNSVSREFYTHSMNFYNFYYKCMQCVLYKYSMHMHVCSNQLGSILLLKD